MRTIKVEPNQSIRDIALICYGTLEAISELMELNPNIKNDKAALVDVGVDYLNDSSFYFDVALEIGSVITIDPKSKKVQRNIVKELTTPQTKYQTKKWHEV